MASVDNIVVYDSVLYGIGHNVRRWANGIERQFTANAILLAPLNKRANKGPKAPPVGSLKASIHGDVSRVGPKHLQTNIYVDVDYALFVLEGTTGPITADSSPYMKLPRNAGYGRRTRHFVVSGQRANDFLTRAGAATAMTHPSLRGFESMIFEQF